MPLTSEIVDSIYAATIDPSQWTGTLDMLARLVGCDSAAILATDGSSVDGWVASANIGGLLSRFQSEDWISRSNLCARLLSFREPRFFADSDIFSPAERESHPFFTRFLATSGIQAAAGTVITTGSDARVIVSVHHHGKPKAITEEDLSKLDRVRPALVNATTLSSRLIANEARASVDALERIGLPAAALNIRGRAIELSPSFQELTDIVQADVGQRIRLNDAKADQALQLHIQRSLGDPGARKGLSLPLAHAFSRPAHMLHLIPASRPGRAIFEGTSWALVIVPVTSPVHVSQEMLKGLFDLTPAEARIAKGLLEGTPLPQLAELSGISHETARTQLKSLLAKTGKNRQSELVALLSGLSRVRLAP